MTEIMFSGLDLIQWQVGFYVNECFSHYFMLSDLVALVISWICIAL